MRTRTPLLSAMVLLSMAFSLAGCIASNVVATSDRLVAPAVAALPFAPAGEIVLDGLYESVDIQGDAAVSLRKIYYRFVADGHYTGAALSEAVGPPAFETLTGTWAITPQGLVLDGGEPVPLEVAEGHLRLSAPSGCVVLRKVALQ